MRNRFVLAVLVVTAAVGLLVASAVNSSAKAVVTVHDLHASRQERPRLRLGARVADGPIEYKSPPAPVLKFRVHDIGSTDPALPVVYHGVMPDTLKAGRDVILEGQFDGEEFQAASLITQCPSKYIPPKPENE